MMGRFQTVIPADETKAKFYNSDVVENQFGSGRAMGLVFDRRTALSGAPGLHVLIIGVSAYPYLPNAGGPATAASYGMKQLASPALAAYRFYEWLTSKDARFPVPLATCRMLLCPSAAETATEPKLAAFAGSWGVNEVAVDATDWRVDANNVPEGSTLFYFAGHGARRTQRDSVLLLPEFAKPNSGGALSRCIDTQTLRDGMAPTATFPNIARTQLYFVDACRIDPQEFRKFEKQATYPVFDTEISDRPDDRQAPVFYAAIPGAPAVGLAGQTTIFNKALLECLKGAAGEAMEEDTAGNVPWRVSVFSLNKNLPKVIADLNEEFGTEQDYEPGIARDITLCNLPAAPKVKVTLELDPAAAAVAGRLDVRDYKGHLTWQLSPPLQQQLLTRILDAGQYAFDVSFDGAGSGFLNFHRLWPVTPPRLKLIAKCGI